MVLYDSFKPYVQTISEEKDKLDKDIQTVQWNFSVWKKGFESLFSFMSEQDRDDSIDECLCLRDWLEQTSVTLNSLNSIRHELKKVMDSIGYIGTESMYYMP